MGLRYKLPYPDPYTCVCVCVPVVVLSVVVVVIFYARISLPISCVLSTPPAFKAHPTPTRPQLTHISLVLIVWCVGERVYELLLGNVYTSRDPIIVGEDDSDASQSLPDDSPSLTSHRYIYPPVLEGKSWFYGGLQEVNPPPLSFRCILFKLILSVYDSFIILGLCFE